MFKSLKIHNWRQFESVDIQFHHKLTILTGKNGSGKTTLLNIINNALGRETSYVALTERDKNANLSYSCGFWGNVEPKDSQSSLAIIGEVAYTDSNNTSTITVPGKPTTKSPLFQINVEPKYSQKGFYIPSHRVIFTYQAIRNIPTQPIAQQDAFIQYNAQMYQRYTGALANRSSTSIIKEALLSFATYGYGSEVILPNPKAKNLFERIQDLLKILLPPELGFEKILIEVPEVLLITKTGKIPLDALSGGISSIIDVAWQIFMFSTDDEPFVVTIDEPENHLHPQMQQLIMPALIAAFPEVQFIIATHNPLVISSVVDSNIYALDYNKNHKIESNFLDFTNKAGTANQILREVLGLPFTMPLWANEKLKQIVDKYAQLDLNKENFGKLRQELRANGLEDFAPDTIAKVVDEAAKND